MKDYSCWEIGMLIGAAIGGVIAVFGFLLTNNALFFVLGAIGIAVGIGLGKVLDTRVRKNAVNEVANQQQI